MKTYRQGTVLGLTVAEIFLLLVFLLLFALLLRQVLQEEKEQSTKVPVVWERPDEIKTLADAEIALTAAEQAIETMSKQLNDAEDKRNKIAGDSEELKAELSKTKHELEETQKQRDQSESALSKAQAKASEANERAERETALRRKGENPPCWYKVVDDEMEGGKREKPYYTFNVAIYDQKIEMAPSREPPPSGIPPGGAFDDGDGSYEEEWELIKVNELPFGQPLSNSEFNSAVAYMVNLARDRQVRTYECIFWVRVWDETSDDAKFRWKRVHDQLIEGSFGAYQVRDRPWVSSDPELPSELSEVE